MNPEMFKVLFSYNYWAFDRVWGCIQQLSVEQFVQPVDYSRGSIRNQVVHLMNATQRRISQLQHLEIPPALVNEDFTSLSRTRTEWDRIRDQTLNYVATVTSEELDEVIHWEIKDRGIAANSCCWEMLLHIANHGTDHRAQILAVLNQDFHIQTVEQDMILYLAEVQQKPA